MPVDLQCTFISEYLLLSIFILELELHQTKEQKLAFKLGVSLNGLAEEVNKSVLKNG